jgi:hypothetical protein
VSTPANAHEHENPPYMVKAYQSDMTMPPLRIWFDHLGPAIDAARAIADDGRYYWVRVTDPNQLRHAEFAFAREEPPPSMAPLRAVA